MLALTISLSGATLAACGVTPTDQDSASAHMTAGEKKNRQSLRSALQANFDLATQGKKPGPSGNLTMPHDNSAGLICSPATLDRRSTFRLVLPVVPVDRKGVLAALTPDGSLLTIYTSYSIDTDPEDLIIPSRSIDWESARVRNDFVVDVKTFDALRESKDASEPLFQQPGIYQFALLNGDRELLENDGAALWVVAGCVVHYQP